MTKTGSKIHNTAGVFKESGNAYPSGPFVFIPGFYSNSAYFDSIVIVHITKNTITLLTKTAANVQF